MTLFFVIMKPLSTLVFFQLLLISVLSDSSTNIAQEIGATTACADCETEQNPNDPIYYDLAKQSIKKKGEEESNIYYNVTTVNKVTTKNTSGTIIKIDFNASPTNCTVDEEAAALSCVALNADYINCQSIMQVLSDTTDVKVSCENKSRRKRSPTMTGGQKEQDPDDDKYKELALESLEKYVTDNGLTESYKVGEVIKVTTQVVAGIITRITFIANFDSSDNFNCQSEIWERAWLNDKRINVTCDYTEC